MDSEPTRIVTVKAGIILCMHPANVRRRYNVTLSLFGWVHSQNDPCESIPFSGQGETTMGWERNDLVSHNKKKIILVYPANLLGLLIYLMFISLVVTPFDVVKVRLQVQEKSKANVNTRAAPHAKKPCKCMSFLTSSTIRKWITY